jgi:hypothetical protein
MKYFVLKPSPNCSCSDLETRAAGLFALTRRLTIKKLIAIKNFDRD